MRSLVVLSALLGACSGGKQDSGTNDGTGDPDSVPSDTDEIDSDGDGYLESEGDCNDIDATINPGVAEACDGIDNNCDGNIDEGFGDSDGDLIADCLDSEDCDGLDNDGDGEIDEDFGDADGDGVADCADGEDCDGIDNDGDGDIDEGYDADGDGYTQCGSDTEEADCDDTEAAVNPGASETDGDDLDNDCDGMVDETAWGVGDLFINEVMFNPSQVSDPDGEWFELYNASSTSIRIDGLRLVSNTTSHTVASDKAVTVDPGVWFVLAANERYSSNGGVVVDYEYTDLSLSNEDGSLQLWAGDTMIDAIAWDDGKTWPDPDGASVELDTLFANETENDNGGSWCASTAPWGVSTDFGSPGEENPYCIAVDHDLDGYSAVEGDCDDDDASVGPGAKEIPYDGFDQNCDGVSDYDADTDGFDSDAYGGNDCDDFDDTVHIGAPEYCDSIDNDCDGSVDENAVDAMTYYLDSDGDGWGDGAGSELLCSKPASGYVTGYGDCDDSDPNVNPDETETCGDGIDNDCDGVPDVCGATLYEVSDTTSTVTSSYNYGSYYYITTTGTIAYFQQRLGVSSAGCNVDFAVHERTTTGSWNLLHIETVNIPTTAVDFYGPSTAIDIPVTAGTYYSFIPLTSECTLTTYYGSSGLMTIGLGSAAGYTYDSAYTTPDPWDGTASVTTLAFNQKVWIY